MKLHHEPAVLDPDPPGAADARPHASTPRPPGVAKGAYVLADAPDGKPDVLLLATGSEVSLCLEAYEQLKAEGIKARVVSMPSWELFDDQPQEYRDSVLPPDGDGAGLGGAGLDVRLGPVRRRHRAAASACVPSARRPR